MSAYCDGCQYNVKDRVGPKACPFNPLFWNFIHRYRLSANPRMGQMVRTWDKMTTAHQAQVLMESAALLARMDSKATV